MPFLMPNRILCLSAEAADICARVGAWDRVVGVSAFAPPSILDKRPVISGFSACDCEKAMRLEPDLVITFSDVQADIAAEFIRAGCTVLATNQRSLAEISGAIRLIGDAVGCRDEGERLAETFDAEINELAADGEGRRPRIYFEEWPDPPISGIAWVGEIIERAGGHDIFAGRRGRAAKERTVSLEEVSAANPEIILASWCGKRVDLPAIRARAGFGELAAVQREQLHALDSGLILQPGPRVLKGARQIQRIIQRWRTAV